MRRALSLLVLATTFAALGTSAEAATRHKHGYKHHYAGRALTVYRRSFLDTGKIVPVGSMSVYTTVGVGPRSNPMEMGFGRPLFGNETLPGRFDLPGRQGPLFTF